MSINIVNSFNIPNKFEGTRLDKVLAILLNDKTRSQIAKYIKAGYILVNNKSCLAKTLVTSNMHVTVMDIPVNEDTWIAQDIPLNKIYEDEELLVLNKPINCVVHPGAGNREGTLLNAILYYYPHAYKLPRAGIIHRLDKDTSGLLLVAKTIETYYFMTARLRERKIKRIYRTIVKGNLLSSGIINKPIARHRYQRQKMAICQRGKEAITHFSILERFLGFSYLQVELSTGRTHQIRVHMASINHPVLGDKLYGRSISIQQMEKYSKQLRELLLSLEYQLLHAYLLEFEHPVSRNIILCKSPLNQSIEKLLQELRKKLVI